MDKLATVNAAMENTDKTVKSDADAMRITRKVVIKCRALATVTPVSWEACVGESVKTSFTAKIACTVVDVEMGRVMLSPVSVLVRPGALATIVQSSVPSSRLG